ncbi:MAG: hypothetical protein VKI42_01175 [Synechococcaceae cyanobacterium]|nr:hypothetical protein [Synechococcaceae cyanobacterium]
MACQAPCLDIHAERQFWQNLERKRGLAWAWYSYSGLGLAFFSLMEWSGDGHDRWVHPLGDLRSGPGALDRHLISRAWQPLPRLGPLPRLVMIPLVLSAATWPSLRNRWNPQAISASCSICFGAIPTPTQQPGC